MVFKKEVTLIVIGKDEPITFSDAFNGNGTPVYSQLKAKKTIHAVATDETEYFIPYHAIVHAVLQLSANDTDALDDVCGIDLTCDDIHFFVIVNGASTEVYNGDAYDMANIDSISIAASTSSDPSSTSDIISLTGELSDETSYRARSIDIAPGVSGVEVEKVNPAGEETTLTLNVLGACSISLLITNSDK